MGPWGEITITRQKGPESMRARLITSKPAPGNMTPADWRVQAKLVAQVALIAATRTFLCQNLLGAEMLLRGLPPPPSCRRRGSGTSPHRSTCASSGQQALIGRHPTLKEVGGTCQATGASMKGTSSSTPAVAKVTTCEARKCHCATESATGSATVSATECATISAAVSATISGTVSL